MEETTPQFSPGERASIRNWLTRSLSSAATPSFELGNAVSRLLSLGVIREDVVLELHKKFIEGVTKPDPSYDAAVAASKHIRGLGDWTPEEEKPQETPSTLEEALQEALERGDTITPKVGAYYTTPEELVLVIFDPDVEDRAIWMLMNPVAQKELARVLSYTPEEVTRLSLEDLAAHPELREEQSRLYKDGMPPQYLPELPWVEEEAKSIPAVPADETGALHLVEPPC